MTTKLFVIEKKCSMGFWHPSGFNVVAENAVAAINSAEVRLGAPWGEIRAVEWEKPD